MKLSSYKLFFYLLQDPERILQMGLIYDGAYLALNAYAGILDNKKTFQTKDFLQRMVKVRDTSIYKSLLPSHITYMF